MTTLDDDAVKACADLVGRSGATGFEIGYLHEGVPVEEAGWYAHAQYRGARLTSPDHKGPTEAADGLSRRILGHGAMCRCGRRVTLSGDSTRKKCRWTREGARWVSDCGAGRP